MKNLNAFCPWSLFGKPSRELNPLVFSSRLRKHRDIADTLEKQTATRFPDKGTTR